MLGCLKEVSNCMSGLGARVWGHGQRGHSYPAMNGTAGRMYIKQHPRAALPPRKSTQARRGALCQHALRPYLVPRRGIVRCRKRHSRPHAQFLEQGSTLCVLHKAARHINLAAASS